VHAPLEFRVRIPDRLKSAEIGFLKLRILAEMVLVDGEETFLEESPARPEYCKSARGQDLFDALFDALP
jgi:hypothetical protein